MQSTQCNQKSHSAPQIFNRYPAGSYCSAHEQYLHMKVESEKRQIEEIYNSLDATKSGIILTSTLKAVLRDHYGLDPANNKEIQSLIQNDLEKREKGKVHFEEFYEVLTAPDDNIIKKAFMGKLAIPNFKEFCEEIVKIFEAQRSNRNGSVATYIPQLAEVDPELFGLSFCSVDGQKFSYGNSKHEFSIQSCGKPFSYCVALEEHGMEEVHRYVGTEPSGVSFNAFTLDNENKPHNPMINAGAIVVCSLIKNKESAAKRYAHMVNNFSKFAGGEKIGFDQSVYLSEKDTADKNFALAYYMHENKCFPEGTRLTDTLEFYFQMCSVLVNCEKLATMAATLANAGVCPASKERVCSPQTVKCALKLMYSCGMYNYSGEWSGMVGLPAKSGVSGAITVVIPNVMGLCVWSPRLDSRGNSVRGVQFCKVLADTYQFSIFDQLVRVSEAKHNNVTKRADASPDHHVCHGSHNNNNNNDNSAKANTLRICTQQQQQHHQNHDDDSDSDSDSGTSYSSTPTPSSANNNQKKRAMSVESPTTVLLKKFRQQQQQF